MTDREFNELKRGELVKHLHSLDVYVVMVNYGGRVTAANTVDMTNPHEWVKVEPK